MSAPWSRVTVVRWARRGAAALGSVALNAALDSLELGKRGMAWLSHSLGARGVAVVALALVVSGGAAWALGHRRVDSASRVARATTVAPRCSARITRPIARRRR